MMKSNAAFRIAVLYAAVSLVWIFLTDATVAAAINDPHFLTSIQTYKGCFFVLLTALLLYIIVERVLRKKKRAEEAIVQSEAHYRTLVETAQDGIALAELDGTIVFCNQQMARMLGYADPSEILGRVGMEFIAPQDRELASANRKLLHAGAVLSHEMYTMLKKDGKELPVEFNASLVTDQNGEPANVMYVMRDITARKQAEEELAQQNIRNAMFLRTTSDGIHILDENGNVVQVNESFCKMLGYTEEQLSKMNVADWDVQWNKDKLLQKMKTGSVGVRVIETKHKRRDDSIIDVEISLSTIQVGGKKLHFAASRDITARNKTAQALYEAEAKYRSLVEKSLVGVYIIQDGRFAYVNPRLAEIFGYTPEEAQALPNIMEVVAPESRAQVAGNIRKRLAGEVQSAHYQLKGIHKSGRLLDVEVLGSLGLYQGKPAIIGSLIDISDRKRSLDALLQSEERYRQAIENSPNPIFSIDVEGNIATWNVSCSNIFQYSHEVIGTPYQSLLWDEEQVGEINAMLNTLKTSRTVLNEIEILYRCKDGTPRFTLTKLYPVYETTGKVQRIVFANTDITERKRAEEKLRESEEKFRSLAEESPNMIFVNRRGRVVYANRKCEDIIGYTREEFYSPEFKFLDIIGSDSVELVKDNFVRHLRGEEIPPYEYSIITKDGRRLDVINTTKLIDYEGVPAILGIVTDITERKRSEEALRNMELHLRRVWDESLDGMRILDGSGTIVMVNDAFCRMTGKTKEELVGQLFIVIYAPESSEKTLSDIQLYRKRFATRTIKTRSETEAILWNGTKKWFELSNAYLDVDGKPPQLLSIFRDVTERQKVEDQLRKLSRAVEQSSVSIVVTDNNGVIEYVNPKFSQVTGYKPEEAIGNNPRMLKSGHTRPEEYKELWETIKAGREWKGEFHNKKKNGDLYWESVSISPIRDLHGTITHFLAVKEDITQRKSLEQQLIQSQKMESIGTLAGGIAHDFNNILGIILGYASLIERYIAHPEKLKSKANAIIQAAERGTGLVRQILTFARKTGIKLEPLNVNTVVGELSKMIGETFPKTITLSLQLEKALPLVSMDQTHLHQALLNLCVNARDAMNGEGVLAIKTTLVRGESLAHHRPDAVGKSFVEIDVSDTGAGMDEATKRRIFEPFFTTKEKGKGTGLGLSVVYGVIEVHRGSIEVESTVGLGTTFKLYLPVPEDALHVEVKGRGQKEEVTLEGSEVVLLVEDEDLLLKFTTMVLANKGYQVLTATNGQEGLEMFERNKGRIHIVVTDLGLPRLSGIDLIRKLKTIHPDVKIVAASGFLDPELKSDLLKAGATEFIQKPYRPNEILEKLREVLDN